MQAAKNCLTDRSYNKMAKVIIDIAPDCMRDFSSGISGFLCPVIDIKCAVASRGLK
jgi:hypothetical protein